MFTGELNRFCTNKSPVFLRKDLIGIATQLKYQYDFVRTEYGEYDYMYYANQEMLAYHLIHGYNEDLPSSGCFHISGKRTKYRGKAMVFEFEEDSDFEPEEIGLFFSDIYYYTLILPGLKENSSFSKRVYDLFVASLAPETDT